MKKIIALLMTFAVLLCFAACGNNATEGETTEQGKIVDYNDLTKESGEVSAKKGEFPSVTDAMEYTLYQNIFYNNEGETYEGQTMTKTGTFATIYDEYSKMNRYYVWGYYDMTKCCDWQWEIKPISTTKLPANGSLVEMTGVFEKSEEALDGYWFTEPSITVKTAYKGIDCDVDMSVMSATLENVQIWHLQNYKEVFEGKKIAAYGRVVSDNLIQHPYYDGSWQMHFTTTEKVPAIDKEVLVVGTLKNGVIVNATVKEAAWY